MAVFRGLDQLDATLTSISEQQAVAFEIILVDDGNTPEDKLRITEIAADHPRARIISNPSNMGLTHSLIAGCEAATAKYISRIDNGDLMLPKQRLKMQFDELEAKPTLGIVGGSVEYVDLQRGNRYQWFSVA